MLRSKGDFFSKKCVLLAFFFFDKLIKQHRYYAVHKLQVKQINKINKITIRHALHNSTYIKIKSYYIVTQCINNAKQKDLYLYCWLPPK